MAFNKKTVVFIQGQITITVASGCWTANLGISQWVNVFVGRWVNIILILCFVDYTGPLEVPVRTGPTRTDNSPLAHVLLLTLHCPIKMFNAVHLTKLWKPVSATKRKKSIPN